MKSGSKVGCLILRIRSKKLQFQAYKWIKNRMDKTGTYIAAHFAFIVKESCLDCLISGAFWTFDCSPKYSCFHHFFDRF